MTDERKPASRNARFKEISFGLGPAEPGEWHVSFENAPVLSTAADHPPSTSVPVARSPAAFVTTVPSLDDAGLHFTTRLQLLLTYRREIGAVAGAASFTNLVSLFALLSEMAQASHDRNTADALASFSFDVLLEEPDGERRRFSAGGPIYEAHHLQAVENRVKYHDAALRLLHETSVQQLVNSYERLVGDIARSHILENTESAAGDQTLTYRQILDFASLDEVKRAVVEAQVTSVIRNKTSLDQLRWLRDCLKIDVQSQFPDIKGFRSLELRRHAIVHAGGIATSEYRRRLQALGESEPASENTPLELTSAYIEQAWDIVYALGIVTVHLASVARARDLRHSEHTESADARLNQAAFWAIQQRRHNAARRILEYAHKRHLSKTTQQLTVAINLAQTYRWQGRAQDCKDLLKEHDWEATSDRFRLCAAVLNDEDPTDHLTRAVRSGDIRLEDLYDWPVFSEFRESTAFPTIVEQVFGSDARRPLEKFPALLLDFSPEDTIRKLVEHFQELRVAATRGHKQVDDPDDKTVH